MPYLILGAAFILAAIVFKFSSVPNKIEPVADDNKDFEFEKNVSKVATPTDVTNHYKVNRKSALGYSQLWLGMIGIFVYVGVEVATAANLPEFMKQHVRTEDGLPFPTEDIAPFVSLFWASLMMGRWTSSVGAFNISAGAKSIMRFIMPYLAFGVFLLVNKIANHDVTPFYI